MYNEAGQVEDVVEPDGGGARSADDEGSTDPYNGLDRFERVLDQNWSGYRSAVQYGYDAMGKAD